MKAPEISSDFTIEDLRKIREYNAERYWSMPNKEFWTEVRSNSLAMQCKIKGDNKVTL